MSGFVYADNAATTRVSDTVLAAMLPYFKEAYGNPSSIYQFGSAVKTAIEEARVQVAAAMGAAPAEIFFTSGATESNNWCLKGAARRALKKGKKHIISTAFEHHSVLHTLQALEKEGFEITLLPVYENGIVRVADIEAALRPDTALVTIMYANNEIGTVQPIPEIGALLAHKDVLFHTDAVQAIGNVPIHVKSQQIDMLSLTAHKIHGPKGVGALYVRKGIVFGNLLEGGGQERGKRPGTENVAGIVGLGAAIEAAVSGIEAKNQKLHPLRDRLIDQLLQIERVHLNGDRKNRLPGNINLSFEGIEGESLLLRLDMAGVCASSGSACTSGSLDPSHVLLALGLPHEIAHGSLRLSLSDETTAADAEHILAVLPGIVDELRKMSPLWERIMKEG